MVMEQLLRTCDECERDYCGDFVRMGYCEKCKKEKCNKCASVKTCDGCHEDEDTSYDGMCMPCWEDLNEHLEEK